MSLGQGPAGPTAHTSSNSSATPASTVAPDRLDSILLSAAEVNTLLGTTTLQPHGSIDHATVSNPRTLSNPDCAEAFHAAQSGVYQNSGYTAISKGEFDGPGKPSNYHVEQAAVSFPSADEALAFLKNSADKLRACEGQTITETVPSSGRGDHPWTIENLVGDVPTITQRMTAVEHPDVACQRALRAVLNLVIDVRVGGPNISDNAALLIADKMAASALAE